VLICRGAGTHLYLSPTLRQGQPAQPRDDLHALGVLWYQLLAGDVTRSPGVDWVAELSPGRNVPAAHLACLTRCLETGKNQALKPGELLSLMRPAEPHALPETVVAARTVSPEEIRRDRQRRADLFQGLKAIRLELSDYQNEERLARTVLPGDLLAGLVAAAVAWPILFLLTSGPLVASLVSPLVFIAVLALLRWRRQGRVRIVHAGLRRRVEQLAAANPDEVQSWGGMESLFNAELLPEIIGSMEEDMRTLALDEEETPSV